MESDQNKSMAVNITILRDDETPTNNGNSTARKQVKQRQKLAPNSKRRHLELNQDTGKRCKIVAHNKQHLLTPHPAKLRITQRRPRKSTQPVGPLMVEAGVKSSTRRSRHQRRPQATKSSQQNKSVYVCSGCQQPIKDRYLLSACDKYWHDYCLKCDRCQAKLGELGSSLYATADMNLCRQDYYEMFGQKAICAVCDKLIYASEMVMRARDNVYHLECFACQLCGLRFCVGDRFHLCENKIVCQYDYDEHIYPIQCQQLHHHQQQQQGILFDVGQTEHAASMGFVPMGPTYGVPTGEEISLGQQDAQVVDFQCDQATASNIDQHQQQQSELNNQNGVIYQISETNGDCELIGEPVRQTGDSQQVECAIATEVAEGESVTTNQTESIDLVGSGRKSDVSQVSIVGLESELTSLVDSIVKECKEMERTGLNGRTESVGTPTEARAAD